MNKEYNISNFLVYPDNEIPIVGTFFIDWVDENKDNLTAMEGLKIGLSVSEFQYNMRVLKGRILKQKNPDCVVDNNKKIIDIIESFPEMVKFAIEKYEEAVSKMDVMTKIENSHNFATPSYSLTEKIKQELKDSIWKIRFKNGNWK